MLHKGFYTAGFLQACLFLSGCAAFQTSTTQNVPIAPIQKPPLNKALIIVEGSDSFVNCIKMYAVKVHDQGTFVGKVGPGGKLVWLRDPGPMELLHWDGGLRRCITVEPGKTYRYKVRYNPSEGFTFEGPGASYNDYTRRHSNDDALVFLRVLSREPNGVVKLVSIKTGKSIPLAVVNPPEGAYPWLKVFLPPGEYYLSDYAVSSQSASGKMVRTYKINAEFAVTKKNVGLYVGDIAFQSGAPIIRKDSGAARAFLEQNSKELPYTESLILVNQ